MSERCNLDTPANPPVASFHSQGRCLVIGGNVALEAATALSTRLNVMLCLSEPADSLTVPSEVELITGRVRSLSGGFSTFEVVMQRPDGELKTLPCDIVLDLSGKRSLLAGCGERDGYVHVRPTDKAAVRKAIERAAELVGDYDKILYVTIAEELCAHARSGRTGCTRCLDLCPSGAIFPQGKHIGIDPAICEGCGSCAGACPTGALQPTLPPSRDIVDRAVVTFARNTSPCAALIYEQSYGAELAQVVLAMGSHSATAIAVNSVLQIGHELLLALLAAGGESIAILVPPRHADHMEGLSTQVAIANAILAGLGFGKNRITIISDSDPDFVHEAIATLTTTPSINAKPFGRAGSKREIEMNVLDALHTAAPVSADLIVLPGGAPYGSVLLDQTRCTLCLACVDACPTHALQDNSESPELRFDERACVQCGLCVTTCPEQALSLSPRINFKASRGFPRLLKAQPPFNCRSCGTPFGTADVIVRVKERLAGNSHFAAPDQLELVEMCADCRVRKMLERRTEPLAGAPRPRVRTSDDYLLLKNDDAQVRAARGEGALQMSRQSDPKDPTRE